VCTHDDIKLSEGDQNAEDERLPSASGHDLNPLGLFSSIVLFQIFEWPDVVNVNFCGHAGCPALFVDLGQEPLFEF
jgi:hypothetical protein